ncbi:hypothetical protein P5673_000015 [Acropora cervicornis]|uniref:Uncharacterized protein n=1 Tax=Acropora cervicornis TaxID=6130 RepID=A0AAD9R6R6_ACRCE|nr:hypothetical protein P5673_000015 [Acropora cervicornis]
MVCKESCASKKAEDLFRLTYFYNIIVNSGMLCEKAKCHNQISIILKNEFLVIREEWNWSQIIYGYFHHFVRI